MTDAQHQQMLNDEANCSESSRNDIAKQLVREKYKQDQQLLRLMMEVERLDKYPDYKAYRPTPSYPKKIVAEVIEPCSEK